MKKNCLILFTCILFSISAFAQGFKLGLRFAPNIAMNSVEDKLTDNVDFSNDGVAVRYSAGVIGDFFFAENYAFSTGFWFTVKRSGVKANRTDTTIGGTHHVVSNLQYVQLPISLKMYTNEIADDIKMYFQVGSTFGIKTGEKQTKFDPKVGATGNNVPEIKKPDNPNGYSSLELGLLLAAGAELRMGENTSLFGGISFNRELVNSISKKGPFNYPEPGNMRNQMANINSLLSLEVGLKF